MRQRDFGYQWSCLLAAIMLMSLLASIHPCQAVTLSNVDGIWSSASPSYASCLRYSNTADTTDENKVAYGSSGSCPNSLSFNVQSGFGFDGSGSQEILPGSIINLGRFRHHNQPISATYILTSVKLSITLYISGVSPNPTFSYTMNLDETSNSGSCTKCGGFWQPSCCEYSPCVSPCPDRVWWANTGSTTTFTLDGKTYTLEIIGFADCSNPSSAINSFVTQEDADSYACLYGRITGFTPSIHIEKYTNDIDVVSADPSNVPIISKTCPVTWTYKVTNDGNLPLSNLVLTDNMGVIPLRLSGDLDNDNILDLTETWIYSATGSAIEGDYTNTATVTANTGSTPSTVTDSDTSWYRGLKIGADAGPDQTVCEDQGTISLIGVSTGSPASILWTTSGTGLFTDETSLNTEYIPSASDIAAGHVTMTLKATGTCSDLSVSDTVTITINPIPQPIINVIFPP
ncbi:MAG: hypothetical protein A4E49_01779 [Methanosaeta sp. PtaU1.Bin112]|nr:MAG: hypothetical protein A4E49_01779 [Methanosaeta sp. PtaU1.Bin112]